MTNKAQLTLILTLFFSSLIYAQLPQFDSKKQYTVSAIGFYNVENLFDTINNPDVNDEDFTPEGSNRWNNWKYVEKLDRIGEVISKMATDVTPDGLAIVGLCEIENKSVVEDLVKTERLKDRNYEIIHIDSPDRRGIDVGLIYQPKYFKVLSYKAFNVNIAENENFRTRNQLLVSGIFNGETIHLIVAHWPSRGGGEKRSRPLRAAAADVGRSIIDSILTAEPSAKIIYMGDLNDDPSNASLKVNMRSTGKLPEVANGRLFNTMDELYRKGIGSLAYRDSWNLFDQILVTEALVAGDYSGYQYHMSRVYNKPFLREQTGRFEGYPKRSYSYGNYIGGYSDHFPTYIVLLKEITQ